MVLPYQLSVSWNDDIGSVSIEASQDAFPMVLMASHHEPTSLQVFPLYSHRRSNQ
jgi:hypothetical protein